MSRHRRFVTAVAAVAGAVALVFSAVACAPLPEDSDATPPVQTTAPQTGGPSATATPDASPRPSATPSSTATAEPTPTPRPTPDETTSWLISDSGIGPIHFGSSFSGIINADGSRWVDNSGYCPNVAELASTQDDFYISVQHTSDAITTVQVRTSRSDPSKVGPRTADGLGVGSTRADILAVVPKAKIESPRNLPGTEFVSVPGAITMQFVFFDGATKAGTVILSAATTLRESICD